LSLVECADGAGTSATTRLRELLAVRAAVGTSPLGVVEIQHSLLLAVLGHLTESRRVAAATIARAQRERNGAVLAILTLNAALINVAAGRLADARTEADSIEALLGDIGSGHMGGWLRMLVMSQLALHTGEDRLADAAIDAAERLLHDENPSVHRWAARVRAVDAMRRGDAAVAARCLADEPLTALTPALPNEFDFLVVAAHAAVDAADTGLGGRVRGAADRLAAERPGNDLFHAVADHLHGVLDADAARLVRAVDQLATSERPLLLAAAQEDAGRQLLADGRRSEAIDLLVAAGQGYDACDAKASAERVGQLLRRERVQRGQPRRRATYGWDSLTDSELAVVRIVARGATNRDAAAQLCLSPHTVSSHLRHAFQKLGVNSRVQLANVVHDADR
jgi:DNA-binding CsgD family transcriptional regulator